ncbi:hypothetical protein NECAME_09748 [Necator americanus]|uniref:Uncharacterized protein n=1 Tax=Necator americanus TaxID=51031 RepID=W2TEY3_NECAM|nr:hypothetical protein NECAME_09748 [Necator americanus]ETN79572.1 hypothetical protein NECAME_09748 [Necator americanus]
MLLPCARRAVLNPMMHCYGASSISVRNCYDPRNKISGAYNPNIKRVSPSLVIDGTSSFMTRPVFEQLTRLQRTHDAGPEFGVQPSKWQRLFLIITKMYRSQDDIPLYVACGTMNRMHDRMRIVATSLGVAGFFILFYYCHYANVNRVMRDRNAGYQLSGNQS